MLIGADGANSVVAQHLGLPATNYAGYVAYRSVVASWSCRKSTLLNKVGLSCMQPILALSRKVLDVDVLLLFAADICCVVTVLPLVWLSCQGGS